VPSVQGEKVSDPGLLRSQNSLLGYSTQARLVDVEAMCIVEAPRASRYAVFSYFWGDPKDVTMTPASF
jgi:hypothetical protein